MGVVLLWVFKTEVYTEVRELEGDFVLEDWVAGCGNGVYCVLSLLSEARLMLRRLKRSP